MIFVLLVVALALALLALASGNRCPHVDQGGGSLLAWTWQNGRARGYCHACGWLSPGWEVPAPDAYRPRVSRAVSCHQKS
jgi:hypothetical protein